MENDLVERVARALWDHTVGCIDDRYVTPQSWDDDHPDIEEWRDIARHAALAAVEAMREPTDEMVSCDGAWAAATAENAGDTWRAMVGEAIRTFGGFRSQTNGRGLIIMGDSQLSPNGDGTATLTLTDFNADNTVKSINSRIIDFD